MDLMTAIAGIPGIGPVLPYLFVVVAIAAALAPFLPTPQAGGSRLYAVTYAVMNVLAANVRNARNAVVAQPAVTAAVVAAAVPVIAQAVSASLESPDITSSEPVRRILP